MRIFICGHSFHTFIDEPLAHLAAEAGISNHRTVGQSMIGNSTVLDHWNLPDEKNPAKQALAKGAVDVLTLSPHRLVPDRGINHFAGIAHARNPNIRLFVQISWPDYPLQTIQTNRAALATMEDNYVRTARGQAEALNKYHGKDFVFLVPVGSALLDLVDEIEAGRVPGLTKISELFVDEKGHPSPALKALTAYCWFSAIYGRNPEGMVSLIPEERKADPAALAQHRALQRIAWKAVLKEPLNGLSKS